MKTIQKDLKSNNLFLNEAISGSESFTLETDVYVWRYTVLPSGACQKRRSVKGTLNREQLM